MADVAARARVSHQTVSRVVNGHPSVAAPTRARVEAAIAELGFRPNSAARTLASSRSRVLGLVTVTPAEHGPARTLLGVEAAARAAGYGLTVAITTTGTCALAAAVGHLVDQAVAGIAVLAPVDGVDGVAALDQRLLRGTPVVVVGSGGEDALPGAPAPMPEQVAAARAAVRHLVDLGHRCVGHVAGPADWEQARSREAGWRAELAAHGLTAPAPWRGDWSAASGHAAGVAAARSDATALFVANDHMALGVVSALVDAGRRVPRDVSVVGFDDVPEAAYLRPPLTTVRQDFPALGRRCVDLLLRRLAGAGAGVDAAPVAAEVALPLVVRASAAPPRP